MVKHWNTKKPKLTDEDVARAFASCVNLSTKWPIDILIETATPKMARRAILHLVFNGQIEHSGDPERGWLTETGIALLPTEQQDAYREALSKRRGE